MSRVFVFTSWSHRLPRARTCSSALSVSGLASANPGTSRPNATAATTSVLFMALPSLWFQPDARSPDHRGPFLDLRAHEPSQFLGRGRVGIFSTGNNLVVDVRQLQGANDFGVEAPDDFGRRSAGSEEGEPAAGGIARNTGLRYGRDLGH